MNASKSQQNTTPRAFKPKPLSVEQETAIDALLTGKSDREVAELVGVHRATVQTWRTSHPLFQATLAQRREEIFAGAIDRLRSLMGKALENISNDMDVQKLFDDAVLREFAKAPVPDHIDLLIDPLRNPEHDRRKAKIRDDLLREFGEGCE